MQFDFARKAILFKKPRRLFLGLILTSFACSLHADFAHEYTVQAVRTLNFARFTEWSSNALKDTNNVVNLCVLGQPIVQNAFSEIEKRPAGGKLIKIFHLTRGSNFEQCKVLFISGLESHETKELLHQLQGLPILTIGEDEDFIANKGMVQLKMDEGWIKMIINLTAVKKAGLSINSRVLRIAKVLYK